MKKIKATAVFTAVIMIMTSLICFGAEAKDIDIYESILYNAKETIADTGDYYDTGDYAGSDTSSGRSQAFLYDFDKNGIKELVYTFFDRDANNMPCRYLSVYTIKNGKAKALIKKKFLNAEASNPSEYIGVAKKGKTAYLFLQYRNNGQFHEFQTVKYYKIKGSKISCKKTVKIDFNADMSNSGKITNIRYKIKVNNKKKTPSKLYKWQKTFKMSKIKRSKSKYMKKYVYYSYSCNCDTVGGLYSKYFEIN